MVCPPPLDRHSFPGYNLLPTQGGTLTTDSSQLGERFVKERIIHLHSEQKWKPFLRGTATVPSSFLRSQYNIDFPPPPEKARLELSSRIRIMPWCTSEDASDNWSEVNGLDRWSEYCNVSGESSHWLQNQFFWNSLFPKIICLSTIYKANK